MATLYINEFGGLQADPFSAAISAPVAPSLADQAGVTIGSTSAQSSAMNPLTRLVRLLADSNCAVKFGTNPTAVAGSLPLVANAAEYFQVPVGQSFKVAVITRA